MQTDLITKDASPGAPPTKLEAQESGAERVTLHADGTRPPATTTTLPETEAEKTARTDALRAERLGPNLSRPPPHRGALVFREFLVMNGLSQSDMSRVIKMTRAAINRWWKAETRPALVVAQRMETISDGFVRVSDWYLPTEIEARAKRRRCLDEMKVRGKGLAPARPRKTAAAKARPAKKKSARRKP